MKYTQDHQLKVLQSSAHYYIVSNMEKLTFYQVLAVTWNVRFD